MTVSDTKEVAVPFSLPSASNSKRKCHDRSCLRGLCTLHSTDHMVKRSVLLKR